MTHSTAPGGARVVIAGASDKPERYSNKAFHMLRDHGFVPVPVHPVLTTLDGVLVIPNLSDEAILRDGPVDTVTLYIGPTRVEASIDDLIAIGPRRVIMNPGAENAAAAQALTDAGIDVVEGCTLVMLKTGQF